MGIMRMSERAYLFRGDDAYQSGPVGLALGADADGADIQDFAEHVLRKETTRTSRYTSFTDEIKIARKFSKADDNRAVVKIELSRLRELESQGILRLWDADQVYDALKAGSKKLAKRAGDVRLAMKRNREVLIEGQIPAQWIQKAQ
jgi:hypothetical protein